MNIQIQKYARFVVNYIWLRGFKLVFQLDYNRLIDTVDKITLICHDHDDIIFCVRSFLDLVDPQWYILDTIFVRKIAHYDETLPVSIELRHC